MATMPGILAFWLCSPELSARKILYIINDWSIYANNWREIFSLNTLQAGGVFSGGLIAALLMAAWYMRRHHMPALRTMRRLCSRAGLWPRPWTVRLLLGRLLLRQTDQSLLGRHLHESVGEFCQLELRSASGLSRRS